MPHEGEKRQLLAVVIGIARAASFKLHVYIFGGKQYQQLVGGPIGSILTMAVSRVIVNVWGRMMRQGMSDVDMKIFMEFCYVDDLRYVISLLEDCMEWDDKMMRWKERREMR